MVLLVSERAAEIIATLTNRLIDAQTQGTYLASTVARGLKNHRFQEFNLSY